MQSVCLCYKLNIQGIITAVQRYSEIYAKKRIHNFIQGDRPIWFECEF